MDHAWIKQREHNAHLNLTGVERNRVFVAAASVAALLEPVKR